MYDILFRFWTPFLLTCRKTLHTNGFDGLRRSKETRRDTHIHVDSRDHVGRGR